ncbi:unnamed protein product [Fraxinus pennsylvanica]|uniref:Uncharacterized protein n=1 Tax=Fraxinus pennsylvanica TaxID=56036 RepID=A0AAD1YUX2_9LAMI|nr:unnamed protein product [Fraxinus pennsylvanica]
MRRKICKEAPYQFIFNHQKPFCVTHNFTLIENGTMAYKKDIQEPNIETKDEVKKGSENRRSKSNILPALLLEKPLLRNYYGSKCVRRAWDVYYDEYYKFCSTNSKP